MKGKIEKCLSLEIYDMDTFHFFDTFSLSQTHHFLGCWLPFLIHLQRWVRKHAKMSSSQSWFHFWMLVLSLVQEIKEVDVANPEISESCCFFFSWSNSCHPSYLENPKYQIQSWVARKEYVYMVQVQFQLERLELAPKQQQCGHSSCDALSGKLAFKGFGGDVAPGTWAFISARSALWTRQQRQSEARNQSSLPITLIPYYGIRCLHPLGTENFIFYT